MSVAFELLRFPDGRTGKFVRSETGLEARGSFMARERAAHRIKYGNLDRSLVQAANAASAASAPIPVRALVVLEPGLEDTAAFRAGLEDLGASVVPGSKAPFVSVDVDARALTRLSRLEGVARVSLGAEGDIASTELNLSGPGVGLTVPKIDTVFNPVINGGPPPDNPTGAPQRIGIVEDARCELGTYHQALAGLNVTEEALGDSCNADNQCEHCGGTEVRCVAGRCIDPHATWVLSVMAHELANGTSYGAFEAEFYHPNIGAVASGASPSANREIRCSDNGLVAAYDYLVQEGVTTVTESFACLSAAQGADGLAQDYYARFEDLTVVRASGVNNGTRNGNLTNWGCKPSNSICVGGMNAAGGLDFFAPTDNPSVSESFAVFSDREEPDVVGLSIDADVVDVATTTQWQKRDGTSYAAPSIAALAALTKQFCGFDNHLGIRALLMTGAWDFNPVDDAYTMPPTTISEDGRDGAGSPTADNVIKFCGLEPFDNVGGGLFTINVGGGDSTPAPPWISTADPGINPDLPVAPAGLDDPTAEWRQKPVAFLESVAPGARVRVSMAWDSCPTTPLGYGYTDLSIDLDLFLVDYDTEEVLVSSRSFDNNNEGFDIITPPDGETRNLAVVVAFDPAAAQACNGVDNEPFALYYAAADGSFFD
ncbi:MAG: S8 family serine peptidase [Myxococcota bacterium]